MRVLAAIMVSAGALALASCGHKSDVAQENVPTTSTVNEMVTAPAPVSGGQAFANAAASSDAFEIATSKLALEKSQSSAVKAFAKQMIAAHTDSTAQLKAAAGSASPAITPDPMLTAEQQQAVDTLGGLSGAAFDKAYAAAQVDGHTKTLATLKDYSAGGEVPAVKAFATKLVPTVTAHLNMAKGLKI